MNDPITQITPPPEFKAFKSNRDESTCGDNNVPSPVSSPYSPTHTPDPWEMPVTYEHSTPWKELTASGKFRRTLIILLKIICLLLLLYSFITSLDFLASGFRLLGGRAAGSVFHNNELLRNPIVGLIIGILFTVLVQSSSTSTSIAVTLVAAELIRVKEAIPIVMGANIGTSITNTIVSLLQSTDRNEFRRAFAAATVHDMFNWLTVIVLLPLEVTTGYLEVTTKIAVSSIKWEKSNSASPEYLKKLTSPFSKLIVQLDNNAIKEIALGNSSTVESLLKKNGKALINSLQLSDKTSGIILITISLVILCLCLISIVKILHSMLKGRIALLIKKYVNAEYRLPWSVLIDYLALLMGCILTILVQSSSIFTSALTPLAGIGVISIERIYPLTLGSNVGTTTTGILAALTADASVLDNTLQLAFAHLFFNITGILLFYPIPWMRFPIRLAKILGNTTAKYRWFSIVYLLTVFFLLPVFFFLVSLAGPLTFTVVFTLFIATISSIILINLMQSKRPSWLPLKLQTWNWLPLWMHSLDPMDSFLIKLSESINCLYCCIRPQNRHDSLALGLRANQSQLHMLDSSRGASEIHLSTGFDNVTFINVNGHKYTAVNKDSTQL
ncbi:sodium-dependent phosphate transport protein 2B-like [Tetranychus urticae]|uniref:sodium-dependent phosphate transport protein 2B-like n=1 Tax=Tetranychus urticae TaxID=32264 RepID=UPI00077B9A98|nr:sodium-dependent phosphate transport protein 2B-like [Tetranychus urticae]XP_015794961.1 sodium-dependent phosphate transport protein 2B-like [Tetranychus urticae]